MGRLLKQQHHKVGSTSDFILTHFPTCGGVWPQALSSQDVAMNYILYKGEIHQIGSIPEEDKERESDE